jgi:hypothetical protein
VFIRETNTKQLEVPKTAGSTTNTKIFHNVSAGFKPPIALKKKKKKKKERKKERKKKVHQGLVSVYVKFVDLISLKHQ